MSKLLLRSAAVLFSSAIAVGACAQTVPAFNLHPLGNGAWEAIDNPAAKSAESGANAGFVIGPAAVVVVDTFENPDAAKAMLAAVREKTPLPVRVVVNTHYHLDHVAGNAVFSAAGAVVMAQDNVRAWEHTENLKFFGEGITPAQRASVESLYLPDITYQQGATVEIGPGRDVRLRVLPGHTGGDTVVVDPVAKVVFCGDLFWNHTLPNLIDASTRQWIETLNTLVKTYPDFRFVPGHGDHAGNVLDVLAFRDYLVFVREAVARAQASGAAPDAVLKAVLPQVKAKYADWAFPEVAEPDIQRTEEELRGVKRLPTPPAL